MRSVRGVKVSELTIEEGKLKHDREWVIYDKEKNLALWHSNEHALVELSTAIEGDKLVLKHEQSGDQVELHFGQHP